MRRMPGGYRGHFKGNKHLKRDFMDSNEAEKGKQFRFGSMIDYAARSIVSKTIIKKESGNVSLFAFDKNEGLSEHTAPFDAMVQIVEGKAEIIIGGTPHFLEKDECIIMPANISHAVKATEPLKMLLTMIKSH
jgi:quercetin dioxygenase-like cupin family protein